MTGAPDRPRVYLPTLQECAEVWAVEAQTRVFWVTEPEAAKQVAFAKYRAVAAHAGPVRADCWPCAVVGAILAAAFAELAEDA